MGATSIQATDVVDMRYIKSEPTQVYFFGDQNGWIIGRDAMILHTNDGGKHWVRQHAPESIPYTNLQKIAFATPQEGWVSGDYGTILHTIDGGLNWTHVKGMSEDTFFHHISPVPHENGYMAKICGPNTACATLHPDGQIDIHEIESVSNPHNVGHFPKYAGLFSRDTLKLLMGKYSEPHLDGYNDVTFLNARQGWAAIRYATNVDRRERHCMAHTDDGGKNWELSVCFYDLSPHMREEIANGNYGRYHADIGTIRDIHFTSPDKGFFVTNFGQIFFTEDGGENWHGHVDDDKEDSIFQYRQMTCPDGLNCWFLLGNVLLHTRDMGKTWQEFPLETLSMEFSAQLEKGIKIFEPRVIHFHDAAHGWIGFEVQPDTDMWRTEDLYYTFLYTRDGGKSWHSYYDPEYLPLVEQ